MPALADPAGLKELPLFHGLSAAELSRLNDLMGRTTFASGASVVTVEQPGEVVYVVMSGTLRVYLTKLDGTEVTLALVGPGEIVGELSLVDRVTRSATVTAMEASTLLWLDRTAFLACRQSMPGLTDNLLGLLARRLRLANAQIQALATLDVYGRVARQVLAFASAYGVEDADGDVRIPLRLTQGDLASLIGATRVRVNQVLVDFKRRGYLSTDAQHRMTVHDPEALAAYYE
jgi:CRP/FNR family cyclic AMP-dependent transcriptional regulator